MITWVYSTIILSLANHNLILFIVSWYLNGFLDSTVPSQSKSLQGDNVSLSGKPTPTKRRALAAEATDDPQRMT